MTGSWKQVCDKRSVSVSWKISPLPFCSLTFHFPTSISSVCLSLCLAFARLPYLTTNQHTRVYLILVLPIGYW